MRLFQFRNEPVHQCTRELLAKHRIIKREEEKNPRNEHAMHELTLRGLIFITNCNENGIKPRTAFPHRIGANALPVHATCSTEVTWSIERCCGRMKDRNFG